MDNLWIILLAITANVWAAAGVMLYVLTRPPDVAAIYKQLSPQAREDARKLRAEFRADDEPPPDGPLQ